MSFIEIRDSSTRSSATIASHLGFNCFRFEAKPSPQLCISVLNAPDDFGTRDLPIGRFGNPLLFPYPNRIAGGRFSWQGKDFQLTEDRVVFDEAGNAIHGLCLDRPWRVIEQTECSVTGEFQLSIDAPDRTGCWPADAGIQVTYTVRGSSLLMSVRVFNPDQVDLPWGFGTHAYFQLPLNARSNRSHCTIEIPSETIWRLNDCLPTGETLDVPAETSLRKARSFDGLTADDVYTNLQSIAQSVDNQSVVCRIDDPVGGVTFEQHCSVGFRELVVFTPWWSPSVCMEPYTCLTNAINLQQQGINAGLKVLKPGESWKGTIDFHVRAKTST